MELDVLLTGPVPEVSDLADGDRVTVPILLVNLPQSGLLALYSRDPHLGCRVVPAADAVSDIGRPFPPEVAFVNPCHGEKYDLVGRYLAGPSPRGLDRFGVSVVDGDVVVDVMAFEYGPAR
jgi:nitrite reductase/ring-hydroxylating ferredoxin subunit